MDGWNRQRFKNDAQQLGARISASTVVRAPRASDLPEASGETTRPAGDVLGK
jgi:hypothetical protein